ncbi:DUF4839 domain-containing protein [Fundicoccus ignavus]|nr:DUF4839 domain-containing protein [Fundicoccus ignavus]
MDKVILLFLLSVIMAPANTIVSSAKNHLNQNTVRNSTSILSKQLKEEIRGSSKPTADKNITIENNQEFAALLMEKKGFSPTYAEFVEKYKGKTIEFDGNIAHMMRHDDYKTRFDFLIASGDYSETEMSGPYFKFEDVSVFDLNLQGDNIPDYVQERQKYLIIAKILKYNEDLGIVFLEPLELEYID